jgi:hypothetical protein
MRKMLPTALRQVGVLRSALDKRTMDLGGMGFMRLTLWTSPNEIIKRCYHFHFPKTRLIGLYPETLEFSRITPVVLARP